MNGVINDYPKICTICRGYKAYPYLWNSTIPPKMCTCKKHSSLAWECPRCNKINAPWREQCGCSPSPLSITSLEEAAPQVTKNEYNNGKNHFTSTYSIGVDPFDSRTGSNSALFNPQSFTNGNMQE